MSPWCVLTRYVPVVLTVLSKRTSPFTVETSRRSLELVFPRTAVRAALESVTEAARRVHDEPHLGPRPFHLFRLPVHLEDRLAGWLAASDTTLSWPPAEREDLCVELERIARQSPAVAERGPLRLGEPDRLNQERAFRELAAVYLRAAGQGLRTIPYFESFEA